MHTQFRDPVCGKRVNRNKAHIEIEYQGKRYYLCCPQCQSTFERNPRKYVMAQKARRGGPATPRSERI